MFGRKKEVREGRRQNLSKYGLLDIPGIDNSGFDVNEDGDDDDDDALEAELLALTSGSTPSRPKKKTVLPSPSVNLDSMVAESLRDIPSDDDVSVDENDPALLNELNDLVDDNVTEEAQSSNQSHPQNVAPKEDIISLLQSRQKMYEEAERNAKSSGETARARRFARGIKTLNDMIKQASAGRVINEEEIPPPVVISIKRKSSVDEPSAPSPAVPSRPAPPPPVPGRVQPSPLPAAPAPGGGPVESLNDGADAVSSGGAPSSEQTHDSSSDSSALQVLLARRNEFKEAALEAKRNGDSSKALQYVRVVKQFEPVIAAAAAGQPVDLGSIPPPPREYELQSSAASSNPRKESAEQQTAPDRSADMIGEVAEMMANAAAAAQEENLASDEPAFSAPPPPATVLEALEQRLIKYKSAEQAAKEEGNSSKVRRMGRIVKQYESAIKMHKAGKPIPVDELPTPPGFGPIPVEGGSGPAAAPSPAAGAPVPATPATPAAPAAPRTPVTPQTPQDAEPSGTAAKPNVRKSPQSRQEKQLALLLSRQKKFREAAIEAKRKGEINQAKEYLRIAKGFDPLIEASQNGLPIDLASLPIPPENKVELETDFDVVNLEDCLPGTDSEIYEKLEEDLLRQTKMCLTTRDHFKATGDIASANRFEQLALHSKKDLDAVKCAHKRGDAVPKFHYETRTFNIVQCCTELGDNDLELSVVQGINYNVPNPKEVDTYVKFEFPFPAETPVKDRTGIIKDTNNPQYNQTFLLSIQRNARACQRVFKRQAVKLEVWSRGGFFRGDSLIGTASVKLMPLETKCIIHDAFDLMDGRKAVGGKLEVKIRVRNPILAKQVEKVQEKWLVIDQYC
ncbi:hypothetical protein R5R35_002357 [Gryllus longicercus]|uniref:C2 domain-containing protein n=1 Tax=Gryllus longicercus TaxID=2509291 RepID=A0AAN9V5P5_9ORTH